ncbi:MAG: TlpA family protein disulfide reductase [Ilumatobacteraceae bacterium]
MTNLVVALSIAAVVIAVAMVTRRGRKHDAPTQRTFTVPTQIDRRDFVSGPDEISEWLVVVFTSSSCHVCADVWDKARALESRHVAVRRADYAEQRNMHERYAVDAVPTLLVCDRDGVVVRHFLGPVSATDLWAAVAQVRDPGVAGDPGDCQHQ